MLHFNDVIKTSILRPYATLSYLTVKVIDWAYLISGILMTFYPLIVYLGTNELILHFGFILPWIDVDTTHGYILNVLHQILQIAIVVTG